MNVHLTLPCEVSSVGDARWALRSMLAEAGSTVEEADAASLVVSELLANAIVHSQRRSEPIEVAVACNEQRIHIEVLDHNERPPAQREISVDAPSGRGLSIVDALTSDWGWNSFGDGNRVWCDVPRRDHGPTGRGLPGAGSGAGSSGNLSDGPGATVNLWRSI